MNFRRSLDWWLAVWGAALLLLYMPNGVMHIYLGKLVYARDLLQIAHCATATFCLLKTGHVRVLQKMLLPLLFLAIFLTPLFISSGSLKDGFSVVKWLLMWSSAMLTGYLIFLQRRLVKTVAAIAVAAMGILILDGAVGTYELWTSSFYFDAGRGEETEAGVKVTRSRQMDGLVRVQGLQRDVFTFANFMAIGFTSCLCLLILAPHWFVRASAAAGSAAFLWLVYKSGGRSPLFGIMLASALAAMAVVSPAGFRRNARRVLTWAVIVGSVLCLSGLGSILGFFVSLIGSESRAFNLASTYDRDAIWAERLARMGELPASILTGMPFADWADGERPGVIFADNQVLWFLFHTGLVGTAVILLFLFHRARPKTLAHHPRAYVALILFMALVLGEGLARESMLLFGALPLFLLCGWFIGADAFAGEEEDEEPDEEEIVDEDEEPERVWR